MIKTLDIGSQTVRAVAVDANGDLNVGGESGGLRHFTAAGTLIGALQLGLFFSDIDLNSEGQIIAAASDDIVILTNRDFSTYSTFAVDGFPGVLHVAFVPEPSTYALAAIGVVALLTARRLKS